MAFDSDTGISVRRVPLESAAVGGQPNAGVMIRPRESGKFSLTSQPQLVNPYDRLRPGVKQLRLSGETTIGNLFRRVL